MRLEYAEDMKRPFTRKSAGKRTVKIAKANAVTSSTLNRESLLQME
jgi:hypothetical protein